eukprot:Gregarina_sp_Poly_1__2001@NODE_1524_length_3932_cov_80_621734_g1008_i0_p3_GENE_NODE_1524_length_3932_cov_80_621734_g1008_i0NODE_1524_length_3932_cov_80_621734_g1008_i0_p3_ORF_typecomplete_len155_score11_33_NODE_1524_length_3932_cov_80_621734_g1008_i09491413
MAVLNKVGLFISLSLWAVAAVDSPPAVPDPPSYIDEAFNCYFFGSWRFDPASWPDFPPVTVGPMLFKGEGTGYHIYSSVFKEFSTHLVPGGTDCSTNILHTYTTPQNPYLYPDQKWLAMLNSIKRINVSLDGRLNIWWGDDAYWNKIEFTRYFA